MEKQPLLSVQAGQTYKTVEPSLNELQQDVIKAQRAYWKKWSTTTSGKWHKALMFIVSVILILFMIMSTVIIAEDALSDDEDLTRAKKIPLEAHIMSKCPDARDCLEKMIMPTMVNISDKVDFKLSYIGNATDTDDGVSCKHGIEECLGNLIELCAAKIYPDPKIWLGFTWCLTSQYADIPKEALIRDCALGHGMDVAKLDNCITGDDGEYTFEKLQESFRRSADAGVKISCTIRLAGKTRCVRDGGKWYACEGGDTAEDLIHDIEAFYDGAETD